MSHRAAAATQMRQMLSHHAQQSPLLHATFLNAAAAAAAGNFAQPQFAHQIKFGGGGGEIDLSLPITSTYLRRMRALGLGQFEQVSRVSIRS